MIRRWTENDTLAVAEIERKSFTDAWTEQMLAESLVNPAFYGLVWEEDGVVLGYVGTIICGDAEIALIAVSPEMRKHGIGKALLTGAIEYARKSDCENLFLEVRRSNSAAIALYEGCGFTPIGERKKYYADGEDAIVMVKPLAVFR